MKNLIISVGLLLSSKALVANESSRCENVSKAQINFIMACENHLLAQELGSIGSRTSPEEKKRMCTRVADKVLIEKLTDSSCSFFNVDHIMRQDIVQKYLY